jgi:hypothetical protein
MGFSAACKARLFLSTIYGTAEAVPFQNPTFTTARLSPPPDFHHRLLAPEGMTARSLN